MRTSYLLALVVTSISLFSCQKENEPTVTIKLPESQKQQKRITERKANTNGAVFILMYHRITDKPGAYDRTPSEFKRDLETLYNEGFRPINLSQYLSGYFDLPPGASPVVLTFDDSDPTQFRYLEDGSIDPTCAIGIWQDFVKLHHDFPVIASFFILRNGPFIKDGQKKVNQLLEWGCDVASHTLRHKRLDRMSDDEVKEELASTIDWLESLGVKQPGLLSLPFGIRPKNRALLNTFEWKGTVYKHDAALMVGAGPAPSPGDLKRDVYAIPRIQAYDGDRGLTYWLEKLHDGKVKLYVMP